MVEMDTSVFRLLISVVVTIVTVIVIVVVFLIFIFLPCCYGF